MSDYNDDDNNSDDMVENDLYDSVFYLEATPPPKPPRSFTFDKNNVGSTPEKPPRNKLNSVEDVLDDKDLSYLTLNVTDTELTHLTKNRAKPPEKRIPVRLQRRASSHSNDDNRHIKGAAIEYLKARRTQSLVEFSRIRRTAVKIKQVNK